MIQLFPGPRYAIRSLFVSDLHLGSRYSRAADLLALLERYEPEYLYLVGDIIDGWRLKKKWRWEPTYTRLWHRVLELSRRGTIVRYTPGNHDEFLRDFLTDLGPLELADEFIHETADSRRFLVLHGDQFDNVELRAPWLSVLGASAYDVLMWLQGETNRLRRWCGLRESEFTAYLKRQVKRAVTFVSDFEQRLAAAAGARDCDGVICGHVHTPAATRWGGVDYFNTGDWMENRSLLVEHRCGALEIWRLADHPDDLCHLPATASPLSEEGSAWEAALADAPNRGPEHRRPVAI